LLQPGECAAQVLPEAVAATGPLGFEILRRVVDVEDGVRREVDAHGDSP
jgi:hypothetical protein